MKSILIGVAWLLLLASIVLCLKQKPGWDLACYAVFVLIIINPFVWRKED